MNKIYDVRLYEIYELKLLLDRQWNRITRALAANEDWIYLNFKLYMLRH